MGPQTISDCYVILDAKGRYWTGGGWCDEIRKAARFDAEPDPDAFMSATLSTIRGAGITAHALYLPGEQARFVFGDG